MHDKKLYLIALNKNGYFAAFNILKREMTEKNSRDQGSA